MGISRIVTRINLILPDRITAVIEPTSAKPEQIVHVVKELPLNLIGIDYTDISIAFSGLVRYK
jgi:hypothetical protein